MEGASRPGIISTVNVHKKGVTKMPETNLISEFHANGGAFYSAPGKSFSWAPTMPLSKRLLRTKESLQLSLPARFAVSDWEATYCFDPVQALEIWTGVFFANFSKI